MTGLSVRFKEGNLNIELYSIITIECNKDYKVYFQDEPMKLNRHVKCKKKKNLKSDYNLKEFHS